MTLLTVAMETPARAATSLIVRARGMSDLRNAMNKQVRQGFAKEIHQHNEPTEVLARIEAVTSYELWDHFQRGQKASRASTRAHMLSLLLRELLK